MHLMVSLTYQTMYFYYYYYHRQPLQLDNNMMYNIKGGEKIFFHLTPEYRTKSFRLIDSQNMLVVYFIYHIHVHSLYIKTYTKTQLHILLLTTLLESCRTLLLLHSEKACRTNPTAPTTPADLSSRELATPAKFRRTDAISNFSIFP